jgi:hypothetical protein
MRQRPPSAEERAEVLKSLSLDPDLPVIMLVDEGFAEAGHFGWTLENRAERMANVINMCRSVGAQVLVRPKQTTLDSNMQRTWQGVHGVAVSRAVPLMLSLAVSVAVIGVSSTVLQSALVLGKPIITPASFLNGGSSPFEHFGASSKVDSQADFARVVQAVLAGEKPGIDSQFWSRYLVESKGDSCQKAVNAVLQAGRSSK